MRETNEKAGEACIEQKRFYAMWPDDLEQPASFSIPDGSMETMIWGGC